MSLIERRSTTQVIIIAAMLFLLLAAPKSLSDQAADAEKLALESCSSCHGLHGFTKVESWPHLNCQNRGYLYSRLLAFRQDPDHDIDKSVKDLSMTEINILSDYYASQKCSKTNL
ncbi:MAG: hypothetical protein Hals2KO_12980 [Halioglobus sp.]